MEIKVVGTGCASCNKLEKAVREVIEEQQISAEVIKVSNMMDIAKSGVLLTPGLIIDGKIKISGKVPDKEEVGKIIKESL